jgi:GT2 family glycosyltransferase
MIGIVVISHNRESQIKEVLESLKDSADVLAVVNDGTPYSPEVYPEYFHLIQHEKPLSVGIAKNSGMKYLMEKGCEHIFTWEDDHILTDKSLIQKYIDLSKVSGIRFFNYGFHGGANLLNNKPNSKLVVEYDNDLRLAICEHCVGAITYYHKSVIDKCGYHDERLNHNCWEHVLYAYNVIKQGFHPPFWNFVDLADSWKHVKEIGTVDTTSVIRKSQEWTDNMKRDREYIISKIGMDILQVPKVSNQFVYKWLENKQKEVNGSKCENVLYLKTKEKLDDVTIMIPYNIDTKDRTTNLKLLLEYLNKNYETNILVAEQNTECEMLKTFVENGFCKRLSVNTGDEKLNYKTKLMNELVKASGTSIVIQWDVDCYISPEKVLKGVELIRKNKEQFILPFDGKCYNVRKNNFEAFFNSELDHNKMDLYSTTSCGGVFIFNKKSLIEIGMYNEKLKGWSYDDDFLRILILKLGYKIERLTGSIYHLEHDRNENSSSRNPYYNVNQELVVKLSKQTKEELLSEIKTWDWL